MVEFDFLLVFCSDLKFTWHRCRVTSRQSVELIPNNMNKMKTKKKQEDDLEVSTELRTIY